MVTWGIVGAGNISSRFVKDLKVLIKNPQGPNKIEHKIGAIGASSVEKAQKFISEVVGEGHNTKALSYDDIITDSSIDVLYIGLPHTMHAPFVIKAIEQGHKNILCEKPVTINSAELEQILAAAKKHDVFFMEAMWSRYFPAFIELQERIYGDEKIIGDVRRVQGEFTFNGAEFPLTPDHRACNKQLGGGALLDIGIYSITYARLFLDPAADPKKDWDISSHMVLDSVTAKTEDEVDFITSAIFNDKKRKQHGVIYTGMYTPSNGNIVVIEGTKGRAFVKAIGETPSPASYRIELHDGKVIERDFTADLHGGEGFWYEAVEVGEALHKGDKESARMSWNESRNIMYLLDTIRKQGGLVYEQDKN